MNFFSLTRKLPTPALLGLVILLIAPFNWLMKDVHKGIDVTEDRQFTLSPGAAQIIQNLKEHVTIRYYLSKQDNVLPIELRSHSGRVSDLLQTLKSEAAGNITIENLDPIPDSDAEESAVLDGLKKHPVTSDSYAYMGLTITCLDKSITIPFLNPNDSLEYSLVSKIKSVSGSKTKKKVAVYSSLSVMGSEGSYPEWAFITQLSQNNDLIELKGDENVLPENLSLLVVIHPKNPKKTFSDAVISFLKAGGRIVVLMDSVTVSPYFYELKPTEENAFSQWPELLSALGYKFSEQQAVLDMRQKSEIDRGMGPEVLNCLLEIQEEGINRKHPITMGVGGLKLPISGTFFGKVKPELKETVLLSSTRDSQLYPNKDLVSLQQGISEKLLNQFTADDEVYPLAILLEGSLTSEKTQSSQILLISDTDIAADPFTGRMVENQGRLEFKPLSGNMGFLSNAIDYLLGDIELNASRNKAQTKRPLIGLIEQQRKVEEEYRGKIARLESRKKQIEEETNVGAMGRGLQATGESFDGATMANFNALKEEGRQVNRELRLTRLEFRQKLARVESRLKWFNIAFLPGCVAVLGSIVMIWRGYTTRARN